MSCSSLYQFHYFCCGSENCVLTDLTSTWWSISQRCHFYLKLFHEQSQARVRFSFQSCSLKYLQSFVKRRKKRDELNGKTELWPDFYYRVLRYHFQTDAELALVLRCKCYPPPPRETILQCQPLSTRTPIYPNTVLLPNLLKAIPPWW